MKEPRKNITRLLAAKTIEGSFGHEDALSIAAYLLEENRTGELDSILRDVQIKWSEAGVVEAEAISAHALTDGAIKEIEAIVRSVYPNVKRIVVTSKLDGSLIGGIRLKLPNYQLDGTTRGKLQQFKALALQGKE